MMNYYVTLLVVTDNVISNVTMLKKSPGIFSLDASPGDMGQSFLSN